GGSFDRGRGGPGGWIIIHEPELHLGEHILVPDLGGWRRQRLPRGPNKPAFDLAPVCEVQSDKLAVYAPEKGAHVWFVDPIAKLLEVLRLKETRYEIFATHKDAEIVRAEPYDAVALELSQGAIRQRSIRVEAMRRGSSSTTKKRQGASGPHCDAM